VSNRLAVVNKKVETFLDNKGEQISDHFGLAAEFQIMA
jgi:endonuclease/exonuclease/phosphatase family metal-dependent hydrolase